MTIPYLIDGIDKINVFDIFTTRISFKCGLLYLKRISKQRAFICYQEQWNLLTSAFLNDDVTCAAILGQFRKI